MKPSAFRAIPAWFSGFILVFGLLAGCGRTGLLKEPAPVIREENAAKVLAVQRQRLDSNPNDPEAHYQAALALFHQKNYSEAEKHAQNATQLSPLTGVYFELLGDIYRLTERYGTAANAYTTALRLQPELLSAYSKLAWVNEQIGEVEQAIVALEEATQRDARFVEGFFQLARLYLKQRDYDQATITIEKALQLEPKNFELRLLHVEIQSAQKRYFRAQNVLDQLQPEFGQRAEFRQTQLKVWFAQGLWKETLAWLEQERTQRNLSQEERLMEVHILVSQRDFIQAEARLKALLLEAPQHANAMTELAILLTRQGHMSQALDWLAKALEINPRLTRAHFLQATLFFQQGNLLQGELALNRALELDPLHLEYQLLGLRFRLMKGEFDHVEQQVSELLKKNPLHPEVLRLKADSQTLQGRYTQAEQLVRQVQLIQPSDALDFALARIFYLQGKYESVLPLTRRLQGVHSQNWEINYLHAMTLTRTGDHTRALEILQPLLVQASGEGFVHRLVGDLQRLQGNEIAALQVYRSGLERFPRQPYLLDALSSLYVAQKNWGAARETLLVALEQTSPLEVVGLERLMIVMRELKALDQVKPLLQRYQQATDPIFKFPSFDPQKRLLFPIASPALGYGELAVPLLP